MQWRGRRGWRMEADGGVETEDIESTIGRVGAL